MVYIIVTPREEYNNQHYICDVASRPIVEQFNSENSGILLVAIKTIQTETS